MLLGRLWTSLYSSCGSLAHLPVDLCSHWSVGLSSGKGPAVYIWDVEGVNVKTGEFTCHKVSLGAGWSSQWKEEGRSLARSGTVFPHFLGWILSRSKVWELNLVFSKKLSRCICQLRQKDQPVLLNSWLVRSVTFSIWPVVCGRYQGAFVSWGRRINLFCWTVG